MTDNERQLKRLMAELRGLPGELGITTAPTMFSLADASKRASRPVTALRRGIDDGHLLVRRAWPGGEIRIPLPELARAASLPADSPSRRADGPASKARSKRRS